MLTYRRVISGTVVATLFLALVLLLDRRSSDSDGTRVVKQDIKIVYHHDAMPVLPQHFDDEYSKAIGNRSALIEEYGLENNPLSWNNTDMLLKIFPPAFRCPGEVVKLGEHAICGALETLAKRESCIVYSFSPPEDFHQLQAVLGVAVGPEKCDAFGFNLAPNTNGLMYVALPGPNGVQRTRSDERMSFFLAPIDIDNTVGKLSFGDLEQDTEQQYVEPWTHLYSKEHAFLDIIMLNLPARAAFRALASASLLGAWWADGDATSLTMKYRYERRFGQVIMKLRLDELRYDGSPMLPFLELASMWESLERAGLRPFAASVDKDGYLEYSFLNIYSPHLASFTQLDPEKSDS